MQSRDFVYWLQGFFEITEASSNRPSEGLTQNQADLIKRHLALVFKHEIDPSMGGPKQQAELNSIHNPPKPGDVIFRC